MRYAFFKMLSLYYVMFSERNKFSEAHTQNKSPICCGEKCLVCKQGWARQASTRYTSVMGLFYVLFYLKSRI